MSGEKKSLSPLCSAISWLVTASLLLFVVCTPPARAAEAWHPTRGAETLPMGHPAIEFMAGYPRVALRFDIPVTPFMEVAPYIGFSYGWPGELGVSELQPSEGVILKFRVWTNGSDAVAVAFDTANEYLKAIRVLAPEVSYSHRWDRPAIAIVVGARIPWLFGVDYGMFFSVSGKVGLEFGVTDRFNIHFGADIGLFVDFDSEESDYYEKFDLSAQLGFSYLF